MCHSTIVDGPHALLQNGSFALIFAVFQPQSTAEPEIPLLQLFENKRLPYWNSTSGFDFDLLNFIVIGMWVCTELPNYIQIGPPDVSHTDAHLFPFSDYVTSHIQEVKTVCMGNFDQISQWRQRYYYFRLLKTNVPHVEILHPVSILSFSSSSACDSTPNYKILSELDDQRQLCSYVDFPKWGPYGDHTVANLLPRSGFVTPRIQEGKNYLHMKFRPDISMHGHDITTTCCWKQTSAILKIYSRFWFLHFHRNWHVIQHRSNTFIQIRRPATEV